MSVISGIMDENFLSKSTYAALNMDTNFYKVCLLYPDEDITSLDIQVRWVMLDHVTGEVKYKLQHIWLLYYDRIIHGSVIGVNIEDMSYISFDHTVKPKAVDFVERIEVLIPYKKIKPKRVHVVSIPIWAILIYKTEWHNYTLHGISYWEPPLNFPEPDKFSFEMTQGSDTNPNVPPIVQNAINETDDRIFRMLSNHKAPAPKQKAEGNDYKCRKEVTMCKIMEQNSPCYNDYIIKSDPSWGLSLLFFRHWEFRSISQRKAAFCNLRFNPGDIHLHDEATQMAAVHFLRMRSGLSEVWYKVCACRFALEWHRTVLANYVASMMWSNKELWLAYKFDPGRRSPQALATCPDDMGPMALIAMYRYLIANFVDQFEKLLHPPVASGDTGKMIYKAMSNVTTHIKLQFREQHVAPKLSFVNKPTSAYPPSTKSETNVNGACFYIAVSNGDICFYTPRLVVIRGGDWLEDMHQTLGFRLALETVMRFLGFPMRKTQPVAH